MASGYLDKYCAKTVQITMAYLKNQTELVCSDKLAVSIDSLLARCIYIFNRAKTYFVSLLTGHIEGLMPLHITAVIVTAIAASH